MLAAFFKDTLTVIVALALGIAAYRHMALYGRLVVWQLLLCLFTYIVSYAVTLHQRVNHLEQNNHWVYNLYVLLENLLLAAAAFSLLRERRLRQFVWFAVLVFVLLFTATVFVRGIFVFNSHLFAFSSFLLVLCYGMVLYQRFQSGTGPRRHDPVVWLSLALLFYFGGCLPYFSLFNYLNTQHLALSASLHRLIVELLGNVRYVFTALAFVYIIRAHSSASQLSS